ncbi:MAG: cell division protein ZapA [Bacteroidota bacterium]|nr:cell division protein ZapA [Bacteroidota bacterium]
MNEEISIKVNIADVVYPLKVTLQEEEIVRKAARMVNDNVRSLKDNYEIQDKINLLSMCALQLANELIQFKEKQAKFEQVIAVEIDQMEEEIAEVLAGI